MTDEETKTTQRRLFIGEKGQSSSILRSKKGESESDARNRMKDRGWKMEGVPHTFTQNEDGTGVFTATDPKPKRVRKRKNKPETPETPSTDEPKDKEATVDDSESKDDESDS